MKSQDSEANTATLHAHIAKHLDLLRETMEDIQAAQAHDIPLLGQTPRSAILLASLLENYSTCAETIFIRISQYFENNLAPDRWHKDLLEKMTLEVPSLRPRIISDQTHIDLAELMRFRHFKRYYFGTAYDWDRLHELFRRANGMHGRLCAEVENFLDFLDYLQPQATSSA